MIGLREQELNPQCANCFRVESNILLEKYGADSIYSVNVSVHSSSDIHARRPFKTVSATSSASISYDVPLCNQCAHLLVLEEEKEDAIQFKYA